MPMVHIILYEKDEKFGRYIVPTTLKFCIELMYLVPLLFEHFCTNMGFQFRSIKRKWVFVALWVLFTLKLI